jgi:hypothetical protein
MTTAVYLDYWSLKPVLTNAVYALGLLVCETYTNYAMYLAYWSVKPVLTPAVYVDYWSVIAVLTIAVQYTWTAGQ